MWDRNCLLQERLVQPLRMHAPGRWAMPWATRVTDRAPELDDVKWTGPTRSVRSRLMPCACVARRASGVRSCRGVHSASCMQRA